MDCVFEWARKNGKMRTTNEVANSEMKIQGEWNEKENFIIQKRKHDDRKGEEKPNDLKISLQTCGRFEGDRLWMNRLLGNFCPTN